MQARELETWKSKLLEERDRIAADLDAFEEATGATAKESSGDVSSYSSHMADQGTDTMEREKAFLFASAKRRRLEEIDFALMRIESGKFGVCESCGNDIPPKRLERLPDASLCVPCKEEEEKARRS
jgi:RNA polymerase-binding protein DksA